MELGREQAALRIMELGRIYRGCDGDGSMTVGELIAELRDLMKFSGEIGKRAKALMQDVILGKHLEDIPDPIAL